MRVAVNGISAQLGGGLSYLAAQLPYLEADLELTVFVSAEAALSLEPHLIRARIHVAPRLTRFLAVRIIWEQLVFPVAHATGADVVYSTGNTAIFLTSKPQVVVFQSAYHFGAAARRLLRRPRAPLKRRVRNTAQRSLARASARRATRCVAVSHSLATDIKGDVRLSHQVVVIPNGAIELPDTLGDSDESGFTLGRYALAVANDYYHKDWVGLIESWRQSTGLTLALVGRVYSGRARERVLSAIRSNKSTRWLGEVSDRRQLGYLYRGAEVYVAHSLLESFSLTPLEAMQAGTPVVASDIPAHREVCGDAALYYDPMDGDSLARAVREVTGSDELRLDLIFRGRDRLRAFAWAANASATRDLLIQTCLAQRGCPK